MIALLLSATLSQDVRPEFDPAALTYPKPDAELGVPLNDGKTAFLDSRGGRVWVKAYVVLRNAPLEMFLCRRGTKEHESVLAVDSPAFVIHGGLVALGLEPGEPARYERPDGADEAPKFVAPRGPKLELTVHWDDAGAAKSRPASDWVRTVTRRWFSRPLAKSAMEGVSLPEDLEVRYVDIDGELLFFESMTEAERDRLLALSKSSAWQDAVRDLFAKSQPVGLNAEWVFAGSGFSENPVTNERVYLAEGGTLVCVANFGEAMIDLAAVSSATNDLLLYEPWAERVPELGTPVLLEIRAKRDAAATSPTE